MAKVADFSTEVWMDHIAAIEGSADAIDLRAHLDKNHAGESDGVCSEGVVDPNDPNKKFDILCDSNAKSTYNLKN
jgi:cellulase/cellobiase CelA1